jgi:hypothetical protein
MILLHAGHEGGPLRARQLAHIDPSVPVEFGVGQAVGSAVGMLEDPERSSPGRGVAVAEVGAQRLERERQQLLKCVIVSGPSD